MNDHDADLLAYWHLDPQALAQKLASGAEGMSSQVAYRRLAQVGLNTLQIRHRATPAGLFLGQFKSPIILILLFATLVSAAIGVIVIAYFFAAEALKRAFYRGVT